MSSPAAYRHGLNSETTVWGTSSRSRRTKLTTDVRPAPRGPWRPTTSPSSGTIEATALEISRENRTYPRRSSAGSSSGRSGDNNAEPEVGMRAIVGGRTVRSAANPMGPGPGRGLAPVVGPLRVEARQVLRVGFEERVQHRGRRLVAARQRIGHERPQRLAAIAAQRGGDG